MKDLVSNVLSKVVDLSKEEITSLIEIPPNSTMGDFAFPCFALSKKLKKNPLEISKEISSKIKSDKFEKVTSMGPYVNFFLDRNKIAESVISKILKEKSKFGSVKGKDKIMIEFSQANTHKAFHIGHIRGTSLGESIARILEFTGNKVLRVNYQGDTGMHVAKWIWCYKKYHSKEKLSKDESWIAGIYVDSVKKLSDNPDLQSEVDEINKKLEEKSDKQLTALWEKTRKLSLEAFEQIYSDLDTSFDKYFFESAFEKRGKEISKKLVEKKIAEISEGATIIRLEKENLGVWVLLRKDGTVLYSAKDLALAELKSDKFDLSKSMYIVGAAQRQHFMQLFKTLEKMGESKPEKIYLPVTEVRLPTGKMSSRTGDNVLYSDFKKELVEYAKNEIKAREKLSGKELDERALRISIASLKYSMLKQDLNKSIIFDKKESLSFEGNSGPYLLYSYARANSILKKVKSKKVKKSSPTISDSEKSLISHLANFEDIVINARNNYSPNLIANYSYELCQKFNEFYHNSQVIGSDNESFRLELVRSFMIVLQNSLSLLGIKTIDKM